MAAPSFRTNVKSIFTDNVMPDEVLLSINTSSAISVFTGIRTSYDVGTSAKFDDKIIFGINGEYSLTFDTQGCKLHLELSEFGVSQLLSSSLEHFRFISEEESLKILADNIQEKVAAKLDYKHASVTRNAKDGVTLVIAFTELTEVVLDAIEKALACCTLEPREGQASRF